MPADTVRHAPGQGPPRRARVRVAFLTGGLLTGCARPGTAADGSGSVASPRTTPPEDLCANVVGHWSREVLDSDTYGDHQSMGLSDGRYEILRKVVDAARAEEKRAGVGAARTLIDRRARELCVVRYRDGGPSKRPWQ